MRLACITFFAVLLLCGCQTQQVRRPINPEASGMYPKMNLTPDEAMKLERDAITAFITILGQPLPPQFRIDGPTTGWFTDKDQLRQVRASAKLPRDEFRKRTASKGWHEVPIPSEYLTAMHLPPDMPKHYMMCYVGRVGSKPAYLFWSEYGETAMLVLNY